MPRYHGLRRVTLWPALTSLLLAAILLWWLLPRALVRTASDQLRDTAKMLVPVVAREIDRQPTATELQDWTENLPAGGELRITLIDSGGTVLADSARDNVQLRLMDNHGGRPEVALAEAEGEGVSVRRSATTGVSYVYMARRATSPGGIYFVLRLAEPVKEIKEVRRQIAAVMAVAVAAALLALAVVSWWLDRRIIRPLVELIGGASRMAGGDFQHRVEVPEQEPLADLAGALNRLGAGVERQMAATSAERDHLSSILARMTEGVLVVDASRRGSRPGASAQCLRDHPPQRRHQAFADHPSGAPLPCRGHGRSGPVRALSRALRGLRMRVFTVTNQKGGVGKTALALHLALAGHERGLRVLLIDLDTQGNASLTLARDPELAHRPGGAVTLFGEEPLEPLTTPLGVDLLHGHQRLDAVDTRSTVQAVLPIRQRLRALPYDLVVVDTPPAMGLRHVAPMLWSDVCLTPLEPNGYSVAGLSQTLRTLRSARSLNPALRSHTLINRHIRRSREQARYIAEIARLVELSEPYLALRVAVADALDAGMAVWKFPRATREQWRRLCGGFFA